MLRLPIVGLLLVCLRKLPDDDVWNASQSTRVGNEFYYLEPTFAAFHFGNIRLWPPQRARKLGLSHPTFFPARDQDLAQCLFKW